MFYELTNTDIIFFNIYLLQRSAKRIRLILKLFWHPNMKRNQYNHLLKKLIKNSYFYTYRQKSIGIERKCSHNSCRFLIEYDYIPTIQYYINIVLLIFKWALNRFRNIKTQVFYLYSCKILWVILYWILRIFFFS